MLGPFLWDVTSHGEMIMEGLAVFGGRRTAHDPEGWIASFAEPTEVLAASCLADVHRVIEAAESWAASGAYAVLALAYEAAPAFDQALRVRSGSSFPLAWVARYTILSPPPSAANEFVLGPWRAQLGRLDYLQNVSAVRELLSRGEAYQVNLTFFSQAEFVGDPLGLFLATVGHGGYQAFLDLGHSQILCFSPELFFSLRGDVLTARPMKGTLARSPGVAPDTACESLVVCPKNRAENVMIVDLLRNDLGRIAVTGSVAVPQMFTVEIYPTVLQMTSTVTARRRRGVGLWQTLSALFPCGSVTGAPKIRAMEIIADQEIAPRGLYCGALGWLAPGGDATFCVPIRTAMHRQGVFTLGVGGGITFDSQPSAEWAECLAKRAFLESPFWLLETLRLDRGRFVLLEGHLARLAKSVDHLDRLVDMPAVHAALRRVADERSSGRWRVRLLVDAVGEIKITVEPLGRFGRGVVPVGLAAEPVRASNPWLSHKTTRREIYAKAMASRPDCEEVILWNERGEITEATTANVVLLIRGRLLTPAASCGLLPGVRRAALLDRGRVVEAVLTRHDLLCAEAVWLVNSLRGWRRVELRDCPSRCSVD